MSVWTDDWDVWESDLIVALSEDAAWLQYDASRGRVDRAYVQVFAERQERRLELIEAELRTLDKLDFIRSVTRNLERL